MIPAKTTPANRVRRTLTTSLAVLSVAPFALGQSGDAAALRRLQEENAALRKQLAEIQVKSDATATSAAPTTARSKAPSASAASSLTAEEGITVLSPFEVKTDKDTGYLKTNSVTATRIGMPIQNTPISVSVMSKEFLDDSNIRSITDIFRYSSSGSGDNRFAMARPANSATPQGSFTLRGFGVNSLLRNGVSRYIGYNVNNVDRVEVVKGPASVFFGAGYPGGVINYVTKQPSFTKIPTAVSYTAGSDSVNRALLDNNSVLSKKAAMRVIGSWENSMGQRAFEYNKTNSLTASLALVPFDSGKVRVTAEVETFDSKFNVSAGDWFYPDGWFQAYANPTPALIAAAGLTTNADPVGAYRTRILQSPDNWGNDMRVATGNLSAPTYTRSINGAYYMDKNGQRIHDKSFNFTNRGSNSKQHVDTSTITLEASPLTWMDGRYVLTNENGIFDNLEGTIAPNADGRTFNAQTGAGTSGYYRRVQNHQFDLIFKANKWGVKNKLLVGGVYATQLQQYNGPSPIGLLNYSKVPGAAHPEGNPGVVVNGAIATGGIFASRVSTGVNGDVPVTQVIRDRFGAIKTVQAVYTQWDPGAEVHPDSSKILLYDRNTLDGYRTMDQSGYINYNASLLDDRLNVLAGVRRESHRDSGQSLTANFPWFAPSPYTYVDAALSAANNVTPSYAGGYDQFYRTAGTSYMGGLSYEIKKGINVFTSYSKTFRINFGNAGGIGTIDVPNMWEAAKAYLATQGKNSFTYNGATVNSADSLQAALSAAGALSKVPNETGTNAEIGVKTSLWDNKLVGTFSFFRAERFNQRYDDSARQLAEPLNYGNNLGIFGPAGTIGPDGNVRANTRVIRWRTVGVKNRIEGADFEFIYTPKRNFQSVLNGAWMWTAKTVDDPTRPKPGTTAYNAATAATKIATDIYYGARIENVPEFRLNSTNRYTFTEGMLSGLSLGLAGRYSSSTVYSRSVAWNPLNGGFQAGNFVVFDSTAAYSWDLLGYRINSNVGVYNLTDRKYFEGSYVSSPRRSLLLTNSLKF